MIGGKPLPIADPAQVGDVAKAVAWLNANRDLEHPPGMVAIVPGDLERRRSGSQPRLGAIAAGTPIARISWRISTA